MQEKIEKLFKKKALDDLKLSPKWSSKQIKF